MANEKAVLDELNKAQEQWKVLIYTRFSTPDLPSGVLDAQIEPVREYSAHLEKLAAGRRKAGTK